MGSFASPPTFSGISPVYPDHDPKDVQRFRKAELELWKYFDLLPTSTTTTSSSHQRHTLKELHVTLPKDCYSNIAAGVQTARVWELVANGSRPQKDHEEEQEEMVIVFIHGGGGTPGDFAPLFPLIINPNAAHKRQSKGEAVEEEEEEARNIHWLSHKRVRIYSLERPGNGLSTPVDFTRVDMPTFYTHFVADVLEALNLISNTNNHRSPNNDNKQHQQQPKIHIVGNSMGGGVTVWFAKAYPQHVASIALLGTPAGFQGMVFPWYFHLLRYIPALFFECITLVPGFAHLAIVVLPILAFFFGVPCTSVPIVYIINLWRCLGLRNTVLSFQSLMQTLWVCSSDTSIKGPGWELDDLRKLQHDMNVPVLFVDAPGDCFMTEAQREYVTLSCIGPDHHVRNVGRGHGPWFADPHGVAQCLLDFWSRDFVKHNGNSKTCSRRTSSIASAFATQLDDKST